MKGAYKIVTVAGIPVQVHWTFAFVLLLVLYLGQITGLDWGGTAMLGLLILSLFFCVVLHEFGHALSAKYYGVSTRDITLSPIGGLARLDRLPEKPFQEFVIALAGPLVNGVIALILGLGMWLFSAQGVQIISIDFFSAISHSGDFLPLLFWMNLMLVGFNLVPAFPMDGGRVFRSLLSMRLGRQKATLIAARLGQLIALLFIVTGFFWGFTLTLIGVFVFFMAAQENKMVHFQYLLQKYTVADVMRSEFTILPAEISVGEVEELVRHGLEKNFLVLGTQEEPIHFLSQVAFYKALKLKQFTQRVGQIARPIPDQLRPNESLETVYFKMREHQLNILPVYAEVEPELIGVVDVSSLNHFLHRLKK